MGVLDRLFANRQVDERRLSLTDASEWRVAGLLRATDAGVSVTPSTSMGHAAVFACVRILAETVASLPLITYERLERGKRRAPRHPLYTVLHDRPNPMMTAFEFRETLMGHLALWGNAYTEVSYDGRGQVRELWPLRVDRMMQIRQNEQGRREYVYQLPGGAMAVLPEERVWHLRGLGDGTTGYSPVDMMRQAIGLSIAAERFGASFFGRGANIGGVLTHPGALDEEAYARLKGSWEEAHSGLTNSHRVAVLEEGVSYQAIGIPPDQAQFLETRKFQVAEIARIFRIPPHMLADLERATFSNIEHQSIEFVVHTIRPWLVRWEQSIAQNLMLEREREQFFAEFLVDGLLRGDIKSRYEAYSIGRQNGWLSADDIRELENMNPLPDEQGGIYLVPLNMVPADDLANAPQAIDQRAEVRAAPVDLETRARSSAARRLQLVTEYLPLFEDVTGRFVRREVADVKRAAKKYLGRDDLTAFVLWLEEFYAEHAGFVDRAMLPVLIAYAGAVARAVQAELEQPDLLEPGGFVEEYSATYGLRYTIKQRQALVDLIQRVTTDGEDVLAAVEAQMDTWDEARPAQEARREAQRGNNALALVAYAAYGITRKRWTTLRDSCPYCTKLDGKIVEIHTPFLPSGSRIEAEGQDPLPISINMGHPPAHDGCDCMVTAA